MNTERSKNILLVSEYTRYAMNGDKNTLPGKEKNMSSDKSAIDKENDPELPLRYYCRPMEEKCGQIFRTREGLCKL